MGGESIMYHSFHNLFHISLCIQYFTYFIIYSIFPYVFNISHISSCTPYFIMYSIFHNFIMCSIFHYVFRISHISSLIPPHAPVMNGSSNNSWLVIDSTTLYLQVLILQVSISNNSHPYISAYLWVAHYLDGYTSK